MFPKILCAAETVTKKAGSYRACRSKGDLPVSVDNAVLGCQAAANMGGLVAIFHFE